MGQPPSPGTPRRDWPAGGSTGKWAGRPGSGGQATAAKWAGGQARPAKTGPRAEGGLTAPLYPSLLRCLPDAGHRQAGSGLFVATPPSSGRPELAAPRSAGAAEGGAGEEMHPQCRAFAKIGHHPRTISGQRGEQLHRWRWSRPSPVSSLPKARGLVGRPRRSCAQGRGPARTRQSQASRRAVGQSSPFRPPHRRAAGRMPASALPFRAVARRAADVTSSQPKGRSSILNPARRAPLPPGSSARRPRRSRDRAWPVGMRAGRAQMLVRAGRPSGSLSAGRPAPSDPCRQMTAAHWQCDEAAEAVRRDPGDEGGRRRQAGWNPPLLPTRSHRRLFARARRAAPRPPTAPGRRRARPTRRAPRTPQALGRGPKAATQRREGSRRVPARRSTLEQMAPGLAPWPASPRGRPSTAGAWAVRPGA